MEFLLFGAASDHASNTTAVGNPLVKLYTVSELEHQTDQFVMGDGTFDPGIFNFD